MCIVHRRVVDIPLPYPINRIYGNILLYYEFITLIVSRTIKSVLFGNNVATTLIPVWLWNFQQKSLVFASLTFGTKKPVYYSRPSSLQPTWNSIEPYIHKKNTHKILLHKYILSSLIFLSLLWTTHTSQQASYWP